MQRADRLKTSIVATGGIESESQRHADQGSPRANRQLICSGGFGFYGGFEFDVDTAANCRGDVHKCIQRKTRHAAT